MQFLTREGERERWRGGGGGERESLRGNRDTSSPCCVLELLCADSVRNCKFLPCK